MTIAHLITAAELENMSGDIRYELFQGVPHEMSPASSNSSEIGFRLGLELGAFVYRNNLGRMTGADGGYILERNPDSKVEPDLGFVRAERMHLWPGQRGLFPAHPDLAVEIISPTDERADIRRKKDLYARTSVPMVWWVDPIKRTATVQRAGRPAQHLTEDDSLDGEEIVPGFSIQLAQLLNR